MKRIVPMAVALCLASWPAWADVAAGRAAMAAGDYRAALEQLRPLAVAGDPEAALSLGHMAENGWGMARSDTAAWAWYKQAADRGQAEAMVRAADLADHGRGVPVDRRLAYDLYKRAAEAGSTRARGRMGEMALHGRGRKVDVAQALIWLRQAAQADDPESLALLDDLAADHRAEPVPAGTPAPAEVPARRALDEVNQVVATLGTDLGKSWTLASGEATALSRPDGTVLVTLPQLVLDDLHDHVTYNLGTIRLVFRNVGADTAHVDVLLPSQLAWQDGDGATLGGLALSGQRFAGQWSFASHGLRDYHGEAVSGNVDLGNRLALHFAGFTLDRHIERESDGHASVTEAMTAEDIGLRLETGDQAQRIDLGGLAWRGVLAHMDSDTLQAANRGEAGCPMGGFHLRLLLCGEVAKAGHPPFHEASESFWIDGLAYAQGDRPAFTVRRADLAVNVADLASPAAAAHVAFDQAGLQGRLVGALPAQVTASAEVERLPLGRVLRLLADNVDRLAPTAAAHGGTTEVAGSGEDAADAMTVAMNNADTRLHIVRFAASGGGWEASASGEARPSAGGVTVAADVAVRDLEGMLATMGPRLGPSTTQTVRAMARPGKDDQGRLVSRFQIALPAGGTVLIDGRPLVGDAW